MALCTVLGAGTGTGAVWAADPETRVISLKVAVDPLLRDKPGWRRMVARWLARVDTAYGETFAIRWAIVETVDWTPSAKSRTARGMLAVLERDVAVDGAEVVLGLMGRRVFGAGASRTFDTHALAAVGLSFGDERVAVVIAHELGHLFGAWHHRDSDSVMFNRGARVLRFDPITRAMIRLMRRFDFAAGVAAIDAAAAAEIAGIFKRGHAPRTLDPIALAQATRGLRLAATGDRDQAISALRLASLRAPNCGECERHLARIFFEDGAYGRARKHMDLAIRAGVTPDRAFLGKLTARLRCGGLYGCQLVE